LCDWAIDVLKPGTTLGPYEIVAPLGVGGMGEVYRAHDTKLNRDVALKILPEAFATDPDRLARFTREAQTLAALNHPNIAAICGLEEGPAEAGHYGSGGHVRALVMELVEGEDLSQKLEGLRAKGSGLPIDEALPIAKQIADALEAAHEQGIIHRDLKPANIKVRPDGTVKVLDFGLAKAMDPAEAGHHDDPRGVRLQADLTHSPTITTPAMLTGVGVILGTAAYMAPEQARGKTVDKRADIWAFGCVLFEMLTGTRPFPGDDLTDTIAAVVRAEPDWRALPAVTPVGLRRLLTRCLKKDPKARLRDIGEARLQIADLLSGAPEEISTATSGAASRPEAATRRRIVAMASVTLLVVATALATWALTRPVPGKLPPMRFAIVPPAAQALGINGTDRDIAVSPDGTRLVYVSGGGQLMVRAFDQLDAVPLRGLTDARSPFFSPDGQWIGFFAGRGFVTGTAGELKKVPVGGGPTVPLCPYRGNPRGASWGPDDTIVFATNDLSSGLLRVSAAGGEPIVLTTPDAANGEGDHLFPSVLPGGRAVVFTITKPGDAFATAQVTLLDLATGHRTTLVRGGGQAEYVDPSASVGQAPSTASTRSGQGGYLVYAVSGALRAVRFNPVTLEVLSDSVAVAEQVMTPGSVAAEFSVSRQGTLVYVPGGSTVGATRSLVWVNRHGQEEPIKAPPRAYQIPRLSPDGTRVALDIRDQELDIWIWDFAGQTLTRLTDAPATDVWPVWTPDGRRIIFSSSRTGIANLFWQAADGTGSVERLTTSPNAQYPTAIAPDGTRLIVSETVPEASGDLRVLRLEGPSERPGATPAKPPAAGARQTEPLLDTPFNEQNGEISPDGRWLAYQSNESGKFQISVRPFPNVQDGRLPISPSGGTRPVWARSGQELFYLDATNAVTAVAVRTTPAFSAGAQTKLFDGRYTPPGSGRTYDVSLDGQRFLMIKDTASGDQTSTPASMVVVLNWVEELKSRVPTK
jgi:serine/threonine-protein kinase